MTSLTGDDLAGVSEGRKYPDGTVVRVFCMRTDRAYTRPGGPTNVTTARQSRILPAHLQMGRFVGTTTRTRTPKATNCTSHRTPNQTSSRSPGWSNSGNGSGARSRNPSSMSR